MAAPQQPTTIKIAEDLQPARSYSTAYQPRGRTETEILPGVVHSRTLSRTSTRRLQRWPSNDPRGRTNSVGGDGDDGNEWLGNEKKTKQVFRGTTLLWLAYQSVGVIYGDIGTSPLYVFSSTFSQNPTYDEVVQVLSVILWSITLVVTVKYVFIILRADNEGEGGTFSCYSLLTRFANITDRDPKEQGLVRIERHRTEDLQPVNRTIRSTIEQSKFFHGLLKAIGVLAVSMVMADGVLTPAQSVLGAVQGLQVVKPDISQPTIVGTSCGILILLFLLQPLGTSKLASAFAPIVILWLGFNGGFGIYNLVKFDYTVLKAFNPYWAFQFFIQHKTEAWKKLGGVLLAFTGVEALFADLGAFSLKAIQLSWMCYTYPCLLLAYLGQASYISVHPEAYNNPFYNAAPPGMLYPSLIVAILAAIVASQAIITATFQLISQIMKLSYCPQVKVVHTSKTFHGQLYVPFLNWLLMLGTILVTAVYSNTTRLGNAYGVCVMFVTFFDTCMTTLVALIVWRLSPLVIFLPWLFFACIDGLYLSSALTKVPDGAWFTLTISGILACLFLLWRFGKENQWRAEAEDRFRPSSLVTRDLSDDDGDNDDSKLRLTSKWGADPLARLRGLGIFFDKTGVMTPMVFTQFVWKFIAVPDVIVFFHLHPVETPTVAEAERYAVVRFRDIPGCYRLVVKHGFMDEVVTPDLAALIYAQVRESIVRLAHEHDERRPGPGPVASCSDGESGQQKVEGQGAEQQIGSDKAVPELRDEKIAAELARLDRAYAAKVMYIVGKEQMHIKQTSPLWRKAILGAFLWIRDNTRTKVANLRLAMDRVVEVGFVKDV